MASETARAEDGVSVCKIWRRQAAWAVRSIGRATRAIRAGGIR